MPFEAQKHSIENKTFFITGGSTGLGKEMAILAAAQGANVVVLARTQSTLESAKSEILRMRRTDDQIVDCISVDLTDAAAVESAVRSYPIIPDYLICCAGGAGGVKSLYGFFVDLQPDQIESCMSNNYYSSVFIAQSCLRLWLENRHAKSTRHVIFTSSTAAFVGLPGYIAYTPAKVAVRALADTLRQEVLMYGGPDEFQIQCSFPGTFMSDNFVTGLSGKPDLTKELEGDTGPVELMYQRVPSSRDIALRIFEGMLKGDFIILTDFQGQMLLNNMRGPSPRDHRIWDIILSFIGPIIWAFYRRSFDKLVQNYGQRQKKTE